MMRTSPKLLASAFLGVGFISLASAQEILWQHSEQTYPFGVGSPSIQLIDCSGDIDGDGWVDCLLGIKESVTSGLGSGFVVVGAEDAQVVQRGMGPSGADFGEGIAQLGDVDGDGLGDFIVSADLDSSFGYQYGTVRGISGVLNERLFSFSGSQDQEWYGSQIAAIGDLNGDGINDFAINSFNRVELHSGDGSGLLLNVGDSFHTGLGWRMAGVGDQDGDQVPDVLMSSSTWTGVPGSDWAVVLISGQSGGTLDVHHGPFSTTYGIALGALGDLDGDGIQEYAIGAVNESQHASFAGAVHVYRGGGGGLLRVHHGWVAHQQLGTQIAELGDVDGDEVSDYVIADNTYHSGNGHQGRVNLFSGATGDLLYYLGDPFYGGSLRVADGVGDLDGDGYGDFAVAARESDTPSSTKTEHVLFYSGFAPIGDRYCTPGTSNSTGSPGELVARGSREVQFDWFQLDAYDLPAGEFGVFLASQTQGLSNPGQSQGPLCLGGAIQRLSNPPGVSDESGRMSQRLTPSLLFQPGETWHFQAWHRDSGANSSNFSDAVSVQFQ